MNRFNRMDYNKPELRRLKTYSKIVIFLFIIIASFRDFYAKRIIFFNI